MPVGHFLITENMKDTLPQDWLIGGGEMGKLIRSMDWAKIPAGPYRSLAPELAHHCQPLPRVKLSYLAGLGTQTCADLQRWLLADLR